MARELKGQGLALSGGGYRASLFHLGVTRRLHELGALQQTTRLSSVSGGSILAGFLAHRMLEQEQTRLEFDDWETQVSAPFRELVRKDIRTGLLVRHIAWNWIWPAPRARGLERALRKRIGSRRLVELPRAGDGIEFIFLATNIEKGTPFRFTASKIGTRVTPASMSIAEAVAASACFPPIFGPIKVKKDGKTIAHLTDGGVYDNTGMEPIWNSNKVVLVSDAGTPFDFKVPKWFGARIMRYVDIGRNQVGALRRRAIIRRLHRGYRTVRVDDEPSPCALADNDDCFMQDKRVTDKPTGAFWRLASRKSNFCENCSEEFELEVRELETDWYGYPEDLQEALIGEIRTDLDAFTRAEAKILENHGYFMADLAIRRHARHLDTTGAAFRVPHRELLAPQALRKALRVSHSRLYFWSRWFA
ncbi:MAG: patatin-like phospholipase family protein [Gammaproteobacteria bacterium]|nr:patatin-like phospholipase family protein [Gammaproteobacteria bacterium]